jgi:hypothetical protein
MAVAVVLVIVVIASAGGGSKRSQQTPRVAPANAPLGRQLDALERIVDGAAQH